MRRWVDEQTDMKRGICIAPDWEVMMHIRNVLMRNKVANKSDVPFKRSYSIRYR